MSAERVRVVVCDDSRTYGAALTRFLQRDPDIEVVATYRSAEDLLSRLAVDRPDLVTMDLELPGLDGVQATQRIVGGPRPLPVVVLSAHVSPGSERAAAALAAGAVEAIVKGDLRLTEAEGDAAGAVRRRLKRLARARVRQLPAQAQVVTRPRIAPRQRSARPTDAVRAIGVASSTGGPQALAVLLSGLPATFPIPILVVQHISAGFTRGLATWLDRQIALSVRVAEPGRAPGAGVHFAPDDAHLTVERGGVLGRDTSTVAGHHRPAGDVLFASMAKALGANAAAVVLTGLGRDGAAGVRAMVAAGGFVIAQDKATSVVDGMPSAAVDAGAHAVLALEDIADVLAAMRPTA